MVKTNDKKIFMVCINGTTHFVRQTDQEMVEWSKGFDHEQNTFTMSRVNMMTLNELDELFVIHY